MNNIKLLSNKLSKIDFFNKNNIYIFIIMISIIVYNNYIPILGQLLSNSISLLIIVLLIIYNFKKNRQSTASSLIFLLIVSIFNKSNKVKYIQDESDLEKTIIDKSNIEQFKNTDNYDNKNLDDTESNTDNTVSDIDKNSDDQSINTDTNSDKSSESVEDNPGVEKKINLNDTFKNLHDAIHQLENFVN